ncbi:MAG: hypothetical protein DI533_01330 [Cereibacter sphaeroides]|uniref:Uncharacterized protein n=1 Tax=Cereibacter sphaeroides TaxID=1063 RepID=A0A2W5TTP9_CERSP|nr:MAG: hypothetical protein DI533_01330 [Cereibacter sphaeroides]
MTDLHILEARGVTAALDLALGQVARFEVQRGTRRVAPFARVPWADAPDASRFPKDMNPHLERMSGDFFCAPFCADDMDGAPLHGWTANAPWEFVSSEQLEDGVEARFRLSRTVAGARVDKVWRLRDDHPFLYQRHEFFGGQRALPVAHHAMVDLRAGGLVGFSPKLWAETPATPLEPGRHHLAYPAKSENLHGFPGLNGLVDLCRYPMGLRHEEFVMLIDDPSQILGWVTALRPASADVALLIKPVARLPQTMLWISNGGRDLAPWCGQHIGVLGIEEACAIGPEGWSAAINPNRLTEQGIATALDITAAPTVSVATAMGALPSAAATLLSLRVEGDEAVLSDGTRAPFDAGWLA